MSVSTLINKLMTGSPFEGKTGFEKVKLLAKYSIYLCFDKVC